MRVDDSLNCNLHKEAETRDLQVRHGHKTQTFQDKNIKLRQKNIRNLNQQRWRHVRSGARRTIINNAHLITEMLHICFLTLNLLIFMKQITVMSSSCSC